MKMNKNEIVKYDNQLNKLCFNGFTQYDIDMFWTIIANMSEKQTQDVVIDFDTIEKQSGIKPKDKKKRFDMIDSMCFKLASLQWNTKYEYEKDGKRKFHYGSIFRFTGDECNQTLTANIDRDFMEWINGLVEQFTVFELSEMVNLKSKYSKNLYRLLKQWKSVGKYTFNDIEQFRAMLDVPVGYENKKLNHFCVDVAVDELKILQSFKGLSYEVVRDTTKRGHPIKSYVFRWKAEKKSNPEKSPASAPDPAGRKPRKAPTKPKPTKFSNFHEREYDFTDLEKRILNQDKPTK